MNFENGPFENQLVKGVQEHFERTKMFLELGTKSKDPIECFRFFIAGIYFARGIVELIFESAEKKYLCTTRDELKKNLTNKLPWFNLIEKIRIHDFHRFGITPQEPKVKELFLRGPIKLQAQKGKAVYTIPDEGPQIYTNGTSKINGKRPLLSINGKYFDEDTKNYVSLEKILLDYTKAVPMVIEEFEKKIRKCQVE